MPIPFTVQVVPGKLYAFDVSHGATVRVRAIVNGAELSIDRIKNSTTLYVTFTWTHDNQEDYMTLYAFKHSFSEISVDSPDAV